VALPPMASFRANFHRMRAFCGAIEVEPIRRLIVETPVEGRLSFMELPVELPPAIKANSRTMMFHTPESPYYRRMKGDAFFHSPEDARRAGYTMWTPRPRVSAAS